MSEQNWCIPGWVDNHGVSVHWLYEPLDAGTSRVLWKCKVMEGIHISKNPSNLLVKMVLHSTSFVFFCFLLLVVIEIVFTSKEITNMYKRVYIPKFCNSDCLQFLLQLQRSAQVQK